MTTLEGYSDLNTLAVLRLMLGQPLKTEYNAGRFWAYYDSLQVKPILDKFESGALQVNALHFCNALSRTKDAIFERERFEKVSNQRANNGNDHALKIR